MSASPNKLVWKLGFLGVVIAGAFALWLYRQRGDDPPQKKHFPIPPFSDSHYLNTVAEARFIGSETCAKCHPGNHRSYLHTAHSDALSELDLQTQPPGGSFHHKASGRTYRVYRQGGQFRHEEVLRTAAGKEIARVDVPVRYLVGSGRLARNYLFEADGFLHESPITWYASLKKWHMSPGYDSKTHWSFERPATVGCLVCHAGRVEPKQQSMHRMIFREQAIGCESCHGPGSIHADFHLAKKRITGADDLTIVNPGKLSRSRSEAICAFCHLDGAASVHLRGRGPTDFRPGRPLTDYRIHYHFESPNKQMRVVGHVEQMRLSACYQKTNEMTCLTCHNPHLRRPPKDTMSYYRQKCLNCHNSKTCGMPEAQRLKKNPKDNCVACHMPGTGTDIPHIAFTHHRIGIHTNQPPPDPAGLRKLIPIDDNPILDAIERRRNLGLAYFSLTHKLDFARHADTYRERSRRLLESVYESGLRDGDTAEALGRIYWKTDYSRAAKFLKHALEAKHLPPDSRDNALLGLADCYLKDYKVEKAVGLLKRLVRFRRRAEDWRLLGRCYQELKQPHEALKAYQKALEIRPFRHDIHAGLAEAYEQLGDRKRSDQHREKARWLAEHGQE